MAGTSEMGRKVYKRWQLSVKRQNGRVLTAKNQGCQQEALMDYTGTDIKEMKTIYACVQQYNESKSSRLDLQPQL